MPLYRFKGYNRQGKLIKGTIDAVQKNSAVTLLQERGILVSSISPSALKRKFFSSHPGNSLALVTKELSVLLRSGVVLSEALQSVSQDQKGYWREVLIRVRERLMEGTAFYRALEEFGDVFPEYYVAMVRTGEVSGQLAGVFTRLGDFLSKEYSLRNQLKTVMIYPCIMFSVSFVIISFIFTFVIPKIARVFTASNIPLPFATELLLRSSAFFTAYWIPLGVVLIMAGYFLRWVIRSRRPFIDRVVLQLNIFGVLRNLYLARFSRSVEILLTGGISVIEAFELAASSVGNSAFKDKIGVIAQKIAQGGAIARSFTGFPGVFLQIIASSEKAGTLAQGMRFAAEAYEEALQRQTQRFVAILEPMVILIMGGFVAYIAFAVMLPMFQMEQLLQ